MHICISKLTIIGWDNGLSPGRRQAIISTNTGILLIGSLGTNFSEIITAIHNFSFEKMHLKMSSGNMAAILSQPRCVKTLVTLPAGSHEGSNWCRHPALAPVTLATHCSVTMKIWCRWQGTIAWWRHQLKKFSASLVLCAGNSLVTCEFPS